MKLLALTLLALPALAHADETGAVTTLDRTFDRTYLGVDAGLQSGGTYWTPVMGLRLDLHGQVVKHGIALQGSLPMSYVIARLEDSYRESWLVQGNARLDASYTRQLGDLRLTLRVGVTLPTGVNDPIYKPLLWVTGPQRLTDITSAMSGTWLRGGVTGRYHRAAFFAQLDVSAETGLDVDWVDLAYVLDDWGGSSLVHVNAAAGLASQGFSLAVELATVQLIHTEPGASGSPTRSFALTGQIPLGEWRPTLAVIVPWHEGDAVISWTMSVGLRRAF